MVTQNKSTIVEGKASSASWSRHGLHLAIGAISITLVLSWLQASQPSVCCGDFDGYYHIEWSRLLWEGLRHGHLTQFTWLPLTTLDASHYADQHFLYHLLLIPFTWAKDLRWGAKIATVLFAAAALFSLYWLILRYRIRYPLLWLLALLGCSWLFYVRLSMTRASAVSILFIVAGLVLLFERRYVWLLPTAFLYVWTYNLFVMLLVLVVLWAVTVYWSERRIEWRPFLWACLGTAAGFVIHPYFPRNIRLFLEHLAAKSGSASMQGGVGFEWYSLAAWQFLNSALVASVAMALGYLVFGYALGRSHDDRVRMQRPMLLLLFSSFLLVITLRSVRFMEYWPPFAVLFAAFSLHAVWDETKENKHELDGARPSQAGAISWKLLGVVVILLAAAFVYNLRTTRRTIISATKDPDHYHAAAEWMLANLPAGALIYDINWSDFPKLFFYDTAHRYVSGLDPIYLLDRYPELGRLTERLSHHEEKNPAAAISTQFGAVEPAGLRYIFVGDYPAAPPPEWFDYVMRSGQVVQLYQDSECRIFELIYHSPNQAAASEVRQLDSPQQRKAVLAEVHRRFGNDVYATDEENVPGGPALVIHNKRATEGWVKSLFEHDSESISGELLWQLGFRLYVVTNEKESWVMEVKGNPKYRSAFSEPSAPTPK